MYIPTAFPGHAPVWPGNKAYSHGQKTLSIESIPTPGIRQRSAARCSMVAAICLSFLPLPLQGALSDSEEESASADLKDLEFKLLHDLTQLQVRRGKP